MTPMNPEIKKLWVEALRSGKYKQGQKSLRSGDEYCCLGVLCEVAIDSGEVDIKFVKEKDHYIGFMKEGSLPEVEQSYLPLNVVEWAGLSSSSPCVDRERRVEYLASCNDNYCDSFDRIAEFIEKSL